MSWINSNATNKQNSKNDLSFYHGFSKTPVEPNTSNGSAVTTLANATTKSGHTVLGSEVWASEIPWFGLVPSKAVAVTRLSGITKKNDLVRVNGDQDYIYIGEGDETFTEATWSTYWKPITLTNGMVLKNAADEDVLRYYEKQQMQALEPDNNAGIDSKGFATRLFVNEDTHTAVTTVGQGSVVSQFAAGTDNIKNGIASSELNPVLYLGTTQKIAGTHYYDYNVSGTILWNANVKSSTPKITCFRYIGKSVSAKTTEIEETISDLKIAAGAGIGVTDGTNSASGVTTLKVTGSNGIQTSVNTTSGEVTITPNTNIIATKASVDAITNNISSDKSSIATNSSKLITGGAIYAAIEDAKADAAITVNGTQHKTLTFENGTATTATVGQDGKITINVSTGEVVNTNTTLPVTGAKVQEYVSSNAIAPSATVTGSGSDSDNTYVGATVALSGSLTAPTVGVTVDESKLTAKLSAIDASIKSLSDVGVSYEIVTALPTENIVSGRIYLVPSTIVEGTYDEYIRANDKWEKIGTTAADLTGYIQEVKVNGTSLSETSGSVNIPAASTSSYGVTKLYNATGTATDGAITQGAVNTALGTKLDTATFTAHETAMNTEIGKKANSADVYTKTDANTTFLSKTDASSNYVSKTDAASYAKSITLNGSTSKATVDETGNINLPTVVTSVNDFDDTEDEPIYGKISNGNLCLYAKIASDTQIGVVKTYQTITGGDTIAEHVPTISATYNFVSSAYTSIANNVYNKTEIGGLLSGKADASSVITGATMNSKNVEVSNGVLELGTVIKSIVYNNIPSTVIASPLPNYESISAGVSNSGELSLGIASADDNTMGVSKLYTGSIGGNETRKDTAASVYSVSEAYRLLANDLTNKAYKSEVVNSVNDVKGYVNIANSYYDLDNNQGYDIVPSPLSGHATITENQGIFLYDGYVHHDSNYINIASLLSNSVRVENNFIYNSDDVIIGQINPERFISGFYANDASDLTSWVGDMPNLKTAYNSGNGGLFEGMTLTTFIGDLSSLTDGRRMFYYCDALTTFIGDLSSLENGEGMFEGTQLPVESVEIIVDTLPEITNSATMTIRIQTPPSSTTELTAYMTAMTPIVDKGWQLQTNTQIADLFDTTKYTVSGEYVQKK